MTIQRRQHRGAFKAKVALEAIRGNGRSMSLPQMMGSTRPIRSGSAWPGGVAIHFASRLGAKHKDEERKGHFNQQIGQLKVELDWLKKKLDWSVEQKRRCDGPWAPAGEHATAMALWAWHVRALGHRLAKVRRLCLLMRLLDAQ